MSEDKNIIINVTNGNDEKDKNGSDDYDEEDTLILGSPEIEIEFHTSNVPET